MITLLYRASGQIKVGLFSLISIMIKFLQLENRRKKQKLLSKENQAISKKK
jgi:hypothetical protein